MKKLYFLIITFIFHISLTAQNIRVTYECSSGVDILANVLNSNISDEQKVMIKNAFVGVETPLLYFDLFTDGSIMQMHINPDKTENQQDYFEAKNGAKLTIKRPSKSDLYSQNIKNSSLLLSLHTDSEIYLIEDKLPEICWEVQQDFKMIAGYKCYSAIGTLCEDTINVYFTPEIPISTGPRMLAGLPGLILEAEFTNSKSIFVAVEVNLDSEISEIPKGVKVPTRNSSKNLSYEQYCDLIKNKRNKN